MSLSTLLEAAKYLDYLDSNQCGSQQQQQQPQLRQQQQQQLHQHKPQQRRTQSPLQFQQLQQPQPVIAKKSATRRQKSSRKDAANTMLAMSLPSSTNTIQMQHGVPIPLGSSNNHHNYHNYNQAASLSSSFTTESPLSSFASTALLCSKASGVTSASSSAASSLSSSDSSSSCGEILMGENDFSQSPSVATSSSGNGSRQIRHSFSHQQQSTNNNQPKYLFGTDGGQTFAHFITASSAGPQLVTMTTSSSGNITSTSAPIDGRIRAGHVIAAASSSAGATGAGLDLRQSSIAATNGLQRSECQPSYGMGTSLSSDNHLGSSPGACQPLIMARVQPMILNSISPSAHQSIMAFQRQTVTASSPTSSSSSYSRHRELHKTLEKNRRAHLRHCFELLKTELPASDCVDKKTSHINIIKSAIRYVLALRQQECEIDNELQRLTKIKNELTDKLSKVKPEQKPEQQQQKQQQAQPDMLNQFKLTSAAVTSSSSSSPPSSTSINIEVTKSVDDNSDYSSQQQQQQPAAEQQLSFLLSQSKID